MESFLSTPRGRGWGLPPRPFCSTMGSGVGEACVPVCVSVVGLLEQSPAHSGLQQQKFVVSQFGGQKAKIQVWAWKELLQALSLA